MKKSMGKWLLTISIILIITSLYYKRSYFSSKVDCSGDIYVVLNDTIFDGNIYYSIGSKTGFTKITGIFNLNGKNKTVSRTVYFTSNKQGNHFLISSHLIDKTKTDNIADIDLNKILPSFYVYKDRYLSVNIEKTKGGGLFFTSNIPSLYCKYI